MGITAGVTGHQNLGDEATQNWVVDQVQSWLSIHSVSGAYSSLAVGTDQVFAKCVLERGINLHAVLPCADYESTFRDDTARAEFTRLLTHAASVIRLPYSHPTEEAFWAAGRWIVENAEVLVAVWDGKPARGLGGTGDAVSYARNLRKLVWHINPIDRTVDVQPEGETYSL